MIRSIGKRSLTLLAFLSGLAACSSTADKHLNALSLSQEPLLGKFVWHDLITDDIAATEKFYGALFGWTFQNTTRPNGGDYTLIMADGLLIGGIVRVDEPANLNYSRWLGYLSVQNVDDAAREADAAGGAILTGPLELGNIGRAAAIRDPQGAVVGLLRSRHGDPDDSATQAPGHIVWNELLAEDDVAASSFYTALTGLQAEGRSRRGGEYTILMAGDKERAGIQPRPAEEVEPLWLTYFAVTDPVAAAARVAALGGEVLLPPSEDLREGTMAVVIDPNGALLALQKLAD